MKLKTDRVEFEWKSGPPAHPWKRFRNGFLACYALAAAVFAGMTTMARPDVPFSTVAVLALVWPYAFGGAVVRHALQGDPEAES